MSERNEVYQDIMKRGWNPEVGAFTQHYETQVLERRSPRAHPHPAVRPAGRLR